MPKSYLIALAFLSVGFTSIASAQLAPLARKDAESKAIENHVKNFQSTFFSQHGRFWQALDTHEDRSMQSLSVNKSRKPADSIVSWGESGIPIKDTEDVSFTIDVYESPLGHGYTITKRATDAAGNVYAKVMNFGPETYRERDWTEKIPNDL